MKKLLDSVGLWLGALILLMLAFGARATELQFTLTGPTSTESFIIDSQTGASQLSFGGGCLQQAKVQGAEFQGLTINGSNVGDFAGSYDFQNMASQCPGGQSGLYDFYGTNGAQSFVWSVDPPGLSLASLQSDPITALLSSFDGSTEGSTFALGTQAYEVDKIQVTQVPEPGTVALMLLGAGFLWYAWKTK
jgi:hypothetical protein